MPNQIAQVVEDAARDGVSGAATKHACSRLAVYAWLRKVERAAAGEVPSPTSGPAQSEFEVQRDRQIPDEWKRQPGIGPSKIRNQLPAVAHVSSGGSSDCSRTCVPAWDTTLPGPKGSARAVRRKV